MDQVLRAMKDPLKRATGQLVLKEHCTCGYVVSAQGSVSLGASLTAHRDYMGCPRFHA